MTYLLTFLQSNFLEVPFYCAFHYRFRTMQGPGTSFDRVLRSVLITTASNAISHPIVFFVILARGSGLTWGGGILLAEAFAIGSEIFLHSLALSPKGRREILYVALSSLLANLVSWELGPILTWFTFLKP